MADSKHPDEAMVELKPCRECGAPCRIETFGDGVHVIPTVVWVCSNNEIFGGDCPGSQSYLTEEAWNSRPAVPSLGDDEMVERVARALHDERARQTGYDEGNWTGCSKLDRETARELARAAIAAMTGHFSRSS
jgi:hypothetical protein